MGLRPKEPPDLKMLLMKKTSESACVLLAITQLSMMDGDMTEEKHGPDPGGRCLSITGKGTEDIPDPRDC